MIEIFLFQQKRPKAIVIIKLRNFSRIFDPFLQDFGILANIGKVKNLLDGHLPLF